MVFVNNLSPVAINQFFSDVHYSFATGARVSVHAPGTLADMTHGVTVSPGVETTLAVHQIRRKRLTKPWYDCTDRQYLYQTTEDDGDSGIRYTADGCLSLCVQDQVGKNPERKY